MLKWGYCAKTALLMGLLLILAASGTASATTVFDVEVSGQLDFGGTWQPYLIGGSFTGHAGIEPFEEAPGFQVILDLDTTANSGTWSLEWVGSGFPAPGSGAILEMGTWSLVSETIHDSYLDLWSGSINRDVTISLTANPGLVVPSGFPHPFDWSRVDLILQGNEFYAWSQYGEEYGFQGVLTGVVVPEPGTAVLFGLGLCGAISWVRRRRG
jgi:PEP-CTERM motif